MANRKDFNLDFDTTFTGDLAVSKDNRSTNQSITNIVLTRKGEKPFSPEFGVGLESLYYKLTNTQVSDFVFLKAEVERQINKWEPQVVFKDMKITNQANIHDDGRAEVLISYTLKSSEDSKINTVKIVVEEN